MSWIGKDSLPIYSEDISLGVRLSVISSYQRIENRVYT
jgi:hypothetical protein